MARGYHGPVVLLTPAEVERVLSWAAADRHPDKTTRAVREKCAVAITADPAFRKPLR